MWKIRLDTILLFVLFVLQLIVVRIAIYRVVEQRPDIKSDLKPTEAHDAATRL